MRTSEKPQWVKLKDYDILPACSLAAGKTKTHFNSPL